MTNENELMWKRRIVALVAEKQGCKAMELALDPQLDGCEFTPELIGRCIDEGLLIEVEYSLPLMSYRVKSFLLPAGSEVVVVNNKANALSEKKEKPE